MASQRPTKVEAGNGSKPVATSSQAADGGRRRDDNRTIIPIALDLSLRDLPEPCSCPLCGAPEQKELIFWRTSAAVTVDAGAVPGYGCTGCGAKSFPTFVTLQLLERAAAVTRRAGDADGAESLEAELLDLREHALSSPR